MPRTGVNANDLNDELMSSLLLGAEGSTLQIVVLRQGEALPRTFNLVRTQYQESIAPEFSRLSVSSNLGSQQSPRTEYSTQSAPANMQGKIGLGIVFQQVAQHRGLLVKRLKEGGPAALSGKVRAGDIVLAIDGHPLFPGISAEVLSDIVQVNLLDV